MLFSPCDLCLFVPHAGQAEPSLVPVDLLAPTSHALVHVLGHMIQASMALPSQYPSQALLLPPAPTSNDDEVCKEGRGAAQMCVHVFERVVHLCV